MAEGAIEKTKRFKYVNVAIEIADDVILGVVALGTIGLAVVLLFDVMSEFAREAQHNYPYILSELMFALLLWKYLDRYYDRSFMNDFHSARFWQYRLSPAFEGF